MASARFCGGGVYVPPSRMKKGTEEDQSGIGYERATWDALRKSITGLVNKVNSTNIKNVIQEIFAEDLIRGRGLFCRSCIKSQMACPDFTDVFAALVAVVNTKFPEVGLVLLRRVVFVQFLRAYKRNDKPQLLAAVKFIAHLANQRVVGELIALEVLTLLLENPTDDRVEVAVAFVTECGSLLLEVCPRGLRGVFERFRGILHEGDIDRRVRFLIEDVFALQRDRFQGHPAIRKELDLVEEQEQCTHEVSLGDDEIDPQFDLDVFKPDPNFTENEKRYEQLKQILPGEEEQSEDEEPESRSELEPEQMEVKDETETNLINLRRSIYLTIMSSVGFEEAGHKLMKIMRVEHGQEWSCTCCWSAAVKREARSATTGRLLE